MRRIHEMIEELRAARDGRKTKGTITGTLAMAAAIPAAVAGVFLGWWLVPATAGGGRLLLTAAAASCGIAFLVIAIILMTHRVFGQRAVARTANCLIGVFTGFLIGLAINSLVEPGAWPFVTPLVGAVIGVLAPLPDARISDAASHGQSGADGDQPA